MTEAELAAIEARHGASTAGTWIPKHLKTVYLSGEYEGEHEVRVRETGETLVRLMIERGESDEQSDRNLEFVAAAHQDVPALLAEVRRLRLALAAEREACAKVAEEVGAQWLVRLGDDAFEEVAAAIRARQTEGE